MKQLLPPVLREEPQFARLFAGHTLSVLGDRIAMVALPFAVLAIGGSMADVGLVAAAGLVPMLLFTLAGGVWADRFPRHRIMLLSDLVRCVVQGAVAVLLLTGHAQVPYLVGLMMLFGTADAFFAPAATGLLPLLVSTERLREANALRGVVQSAALVVGPALAGGLVALAGPGGALAVDAVSFALSAAFLARLHPRAGAAAEQGADGSFLAQLREGWSQVRSRSWVWSGMAAMGVYHVVVLPSIFVLGPVLAEREWDGAKGWAIVTAAFGVGAVVGDLWAYRLRPARPLAFGAVALAVASCQAVIIGGAPNVLVVAALEAVTGVGVSVFFVLWETSLQVHIPEHALSRVSSYDFLLSSGLMPLGLVVAGPVADAAGLRPTLYVMSAVGVAASLLLLAVPAVRHLTDRAEPEHDPKADGEPLPA
ncbi:MFS transporter [Kitasatospora sp. NPDC096147]|uniref:MFS transporter n=1 Tax=Kitasatospora sp. NPDC096147 TaxID=3364093 RepID=UPI0037FE68E3